MVNKGMMMMKGRDYYEKRVVFYSENKIYFYSSSHPNRSYKPNNNFVRGSTILDAGLLMIKEGKLEYFICL